MMRYQRTNESVRKPERKTAGAAGWDLHAHLPQIGAMVFAPGQTRRVSTGIRLEIGPSFMGLILPRSSATEVFDTKHPPIDSDYRGEVSIILHNTSGESQTVTSGQRLAQLVILPCYPCEMVEAEDLSDTARGSGAFGSTGQG